VNDVPGRPVGLDDDIDAIRFVRAISRNWFLLAVIVAICGAASFALANWTPTTYEASATIVLPTARQTSGLPRTAGTVRALLTNTGIVSEALRGTPLEGSTTPAEFAKSAVLIDDMPGGQFVRMRVRAPDPNLAATIARSLVDRAVVQGARVDERAAARTSEELKVQLDRAAERLAEAGRLLLDYVQRTHGKGMRDEVQTLLSDPRDAPGVPGETDASRARLTGQPDVTSNHELELAKRRTDYLVARRAYTDIGVRYEKAQFEAVAGGSLVRLVDPQIVAGTPLPRDRMRKTVFGLLVGLLLGLAVLIIWEARSSSKRGVR